VPVTSATVCETTKDLLSDAAGRIRLDDFATALVKATMETLSSEAYWASLPQASPASFQARLTQYESDARDVVSLVALMGRWARPDHLPTLEKIFGRLAEASKAGNEASVWQYLRWHPIGFLSYAAGIAALSAQNYPALRPALLTAVTSSRGAVSDTSLVVHLANQMNEVTPAFKLLPEYKNHVVPRSEYMFNLLRRPLDDLLFLGQSYEAVFDQFEILATLTYADLTREDRGRVWAAPGRFAWKHRSGSRSPFAAFVQDAEAMGASWPLLQEGFFGSSATRFAEIARGYQEFMSRLPWL
jgi:hypothetical protein